MGKKPSSYRTPLIVVAIVAVIILAPYALQLNTLPVSRYGDIVLYNETTDALVSYNTILKVQDGDTLAVHLVDDTTTDHQPHDIDWGDWYVTLRSATTNAWVETAGDASVIGQVYETNYLDNLRWWLNLEGCPEGIFEYHIEFFAMIGDTEVDIRGYSFSFSIDNSNAPVYGNATFMAEPEDTIYLSVGDYATVTWKVHYDGAYTAEVSVDGTADWTRDYVASVGDEMVIYTIDTNAQSVQDLVLTVTPTVAMNEPLVSEVTRVHVTTPTTTTTTTNTTTTTTTPATTTTDPPIPPIEDNLLLYGGIAIAIAAIVVLVSRRK